MAILTSFEPAPLYTRIRIAGVAYVFLCGASVHRRHDAIPRHKRLSRPGSMMLTIHPGCNMNLTGTAASSRERTRRAIGSTTSLAGCGRRLYWASELSMYCELCTSSLRNWPLPALVIPSCGVLLPDSD